MIRIVAAVALWLAAAAPGWAQPAEVAEADRQAIRKVIERQLEAFRREDGAAAFSYASPAIQQQFQSAEIFMRMVKQAYPQIYKAREVDFRELVTTAESLMQAVLVVGPDGSAGMAVYKMQRQADGSWRIDGCVLLQTGESAT